MTGRAAIIDIGSNSVRLVILSSICRSTEEIHTEQVYPHLGRNIARTGRLDPDGVKQCLEGLGRFARLCDLMEIGERIVVATAAIREAMDGAKFVARIKERCGLDVRVISGDEEGRLSALGVIAGIPGANGIVGDLGGGSLELAVVRNGAVGDHTTLPLGPFRLQQEGSVEHNRAAIAKTIDRLLKDVPWLRGGNHANFYAVGGNWRAIAKAQMRRDDCPLPIVHQHTLPLRSGIEVAGYLSTLAPSGLQRLSVQKKRVALVPYAALVMERVLRVVQPQSLVFSGFGLRDGLVYDRLDVIERNLDPLIATCERLAGNVAHGYAAFRWCGTLAIPESSEEARLRLAACLLGTMMTGDNATQRGQIAYDHTLHMQTGNLDHTGRAFLALAMYHRFHRAKDEPQKDVLQHSETMLTPALRRAARWLGEILNFAENFSAGAAGVLETSMLDSDDGKLVLRISHANAALITDGVTRAFEELAKDLRMKPVIVKD